MPGYVQADQPDIFISYAHSDDLALDEKEPGWVTRLVRQVEILLTMKIGRREFFDLWMDPRLTGNEPVTNLIEAKIRGSAVFLLILSPGYLASKWCDKEMAVFQDQIRARRGDGSRVFVVEFAKVDRPLELAEVRGYRFWVEDTLSQDVSTLGFPKLHADVEERYYKLIDELSRDLVGELNRQKARAAGPTRRPELSPGASLPSAPTPEAAAEAATVYLADVTDDLSDMRDGVKSYLIQVGYQVLPTAVYPSDVAGYTAALDADLARSTVYVQLLGEVAGRKVGEDGPRLPALLLERAAARSPSLPILQWRSRDLDWHRVTNDRHRLILKGEAVPAKDLEVMEVGLEEFKALVKARIIQRTALTRKRPKQRDRFIFVNVDTLDEPLSQAITRALERWPWLGYGLPLREGDPAAIRADLEQNLTDCDAMMIIFGAAQPVWARSQLQMARKMAALRTSGFLPIAIYEGPPSETKDLLKFRLPHMDVLNCRAGLSEAELCRFIESLQEDAGA